MFHAPSPISRGNAGVAQSVHITLAERVAGKIVAEELAQLFEETSNRLRVPAGVAAAGGVVALIAAMSSAAVADVTGILAASAAITGTFVAISQRKKILNAYETQMATKCSDLVKAIEQQLARAIDVFYAEVASAFHPLQAFCTAKRKQFEPSLQRTEELKRTSRRLMPGLVRERSSQASTGRSFVIPPARRGGERKRGISHAAEGYTKE